MSFFKFLGLSVVPVPSPFPVIKTQDKRQAPDKPDNIVYYANQAFVQSEDTEARTFEDTRYLGQADRSGQITRTDEAIMERYGLDKERYMKLKPIWAAGVSAQVAARSFRGKRGYSSRTLDKFWSAFSEASNPSPR